MAEKHKSIAELLEEYKEEDDYYDYKANGDEEGFLEDDEDEE